MEHFILWFAGTLLVYSAMNVKYLKREIQDLRNRVAELEIKS